MYTILHTIETGGPGGAETVVLNLASELDTRRFRSLVLLPGGSWLPGKLQENRIPTFLVQSKAWYDPHLPATMARLVRREKVDLIHSHLPDQNFYSCLVGRLTGRKTIVTYHGPVELRQSKGLKGSIKLWSVRHSASAVVVVCDFVGQMLREIGFPSDKIVRIYNGINVARFSPGQTGRLRQELGCAEETKLVGMVANIRASKGYEFFIRAARHVVERFPATRFVSIGDIDRTLGQPLFNLVGELGLQDHLVFLGFRRDIPEILSDLDVFVLSSVSEGFPLVTLEAMAAGRPVVVTRCGGPEEVIEHNRTGILVPPADANALGTQICELLANPEWAAALGQNARAKVSSEFSMERMVHQYERLYEQLLNAR
jgi:glycosyltransferase involved in cell wall biosynthesis